MKLLHTLSTGLDTVDRDTLLAMWTLSGSFPNIRYRQTEDGTWQYKLYTDRDNSYWNDLAPEVGGWSQQLSIDDYRRNDPEPNLQELQNRIIYIRGQ